MRPTRIKRHRARQHTDSHMALVPFIDMMTILVVFLLIHTSDVDVLPNTKNISIPVSVSDKKPHESLVVMITKEELIVAGHTVAKLTDLVSDDKLVIPSLKAALREQVGRAMVTGAQQSPADREVTIMGDRSTPYAVLKRVMATCTDAEYGKVSLAVVERDRPKA